MKSISGNIGIALVFVLAGLVGTGISPVAPKAVTAAGPGPSEIQVGASSFHAVTPPLRAQHPGPPTTVPPRRDVDVPPIPITGHQNASDPIVQRSVPSGSPTGGTSVSAPSSGSSWDAQINSVSCNCDPGDPNIAVGPNRVVESVNTAVQIWNKSTHTSVWGPAGLDSILNPNGANPACGVRDGDPVVLYDAAAQRWLISQVEYSNAGTYGYGECIAVSTSSDPTGSYNAYFFQLSKTLLPDYPKLAVWSDGYYMTANMFSCSASFFGSCLQWTFQGPRAFAFNRADLINGAASVRWQSYTGFTSSDNAMLPADPDGSVQAPASQPEYFIEDGSPLKLYRFHVDWSNSANSTFTTFASLTTQAWTQLCSTTQNCIPQPGTTQKLDGITDRLMYRLAYRNSADHETLLVNHTVDAGSGQAGVRWYEIRISGGSASLYQQGTFAPGTDSRWAGSEAMDAQGDLAIGYSASSGTTNPSIRFAGRVSTDQLGTLGTEGTLFAGQGSQTNSNRWGDYSSLVVDPADDCTFWYVNEYYLASGSDWHTGIGSFSFPNCPGGVGPTSTPTDTPTPGPTGTPTSTPTNTPTPTSTPTPSNTSTPTMTPTATATSQATVPGAPTNVSAKASGGGAATVTWTAPSSNGSPIQSYTVTTYSAASNAIVKTTAGITGTTGTVTGLTVGQRYYFTVFATNGVGNGPPSANSNTVKVR